MKTSMEFCNSVIAFLFLLSIAFLFSCSVSKKQEFPRVVYLKARQDKIFKVSMRPFDCFTYGYKIIKNTMNDTCKIQSFKIAPGKTGRIFRQDCIEIAGKDSIIIIDIYFFSYKATEGEIIFEYFDDSALMRLARKYNE